MAQINNIRENCFQIINRFPIATFPIFILFIGVFISLKLSSSNSVYAQLRLSDKTSNSDKWLGVYKFNTLKLTPKSENNETVAANYTLTIKKGKEKLDCYFLASGVQLYDEFDCSIKSDSNNLRIFFHRDTTGKEAEFVSYRKGQHLFNLQGLRGKANTFLYKPAAYKIYLPRGINKTI